MALTSVLSVRLQPGSIVRYEAAVARLAETARKKKEMSHWTAYQTLFGMEPGYRFTYEAESFAALGARGTIPELAARLLGESEAQRFAEEVTACIAQQQQIVLTERTDLSYVRGSMMPRDLGFASVSRIRVRLGAREAFEELARKLAEAIPKIDDPTQLVAYQVVVGDMAGYALVRPLRELADLDKQRMPDQLLTQAFGPGEGGLIFRNGGDAIESVEREIIARRDDLSNPVA